MEEEMEAEGVHVSMKSIRSDQRDDVDAVRIFTVKTPSLSCRSSGRHALDTLDQIPFWESPRSTRGIVRYFKSGSTSGMQRFSFERKTRPTWVATLREICFAHSCKAYLCLNYTTVAN